MQQLLATFLQIMDKFARHGPLNITVCLYDWFGTYLLVASREASVTSGVLPRITLGKAFVPIVGSQLA